MIVGVRVPINPDVMSEWGSPISGLVIMKRPDLLTKADVIGKKIPLGHELGLFE